MNLLSSSIRPSAHLVYTFSIFLTFLVPGFATAADISKRLSSAPAAAAGGSPKALADGGGSTDALSARSSPAHASIPSGRPERHDAVPLPSDSAEQLIYLKDVITPNASELADMTEITPLLNRLQKEQRRAKLQAATTESKVTSDLKAQGTNTKAATTPLTNAGEEPAGGADNARILSNQRLIYLRLRINSYVQTNTLEVASVIGRLNSGLAELADRKAMISDQRARMLRRQSLINFISGGLTKIGGYSIALTPSTLIPTNVLEIFDGGVQTSLSVFTLKQQREEQKLTKTRPVILNAFLSGNNISTQEFPSTVWTYLNNVSLRSKNSKTRRQELIDHWVDIGRLSDGTKRPAKARTSNFTSSASQSFHLDDLDDTVAMMSDLKSVISGMESGLMELSQSIRGSYGDDPEI